MDQRLTEVEAKVASLNTQLTKLQELIDGKQFITGIEKNEDGTNVISFVNAYGELSTITPSDGKSPDMSVKQAADGKWYWTLNGEWLLDKDGNTIPVTGGRGVTPSMKIENGKWYVSYDLKSVIIIVQSAAGSLSGSAFVIIPDSITEN